MALKPLRVLVVEDDESWRDWVAEGLEKLEQGVSFEKVPDRDSAWNLLASHSYDLVVLDLEVRKRQESPSSEKGLGLELLKDLRARGRNRYSAVLIISGTATSEQTNEALADLGVRRVIEKDKVLELADSEAYLLTTAKEAIFRGYAMEARARRDARLNLTITCSMEAWTGVELQGPSSQPFSIVASDNAFDAQNLARRANGLPVFSPAGHDPLAWREEVRDLGSTIFKSWHACRPIADRLATIKGLGASSQDLWLRIRGPAATLAIPGDLAYDGGDYLCMKHAVSREVEVRAAEFRPKPSLELLLEEAHAGGTPLRALLIAANSDGEIPKVEQEIDVVERALSSALARFGRASDGIRILRGEEATYNKVREELDSKTYHLLHYAGHGCYSEDLPEEGGFVLRHDGGVRVLTASELVPLARDSALSFVFLSSCYGARIPRKPDRGDFAGVFDALAQASIPAVLGYRWSVSDEAARYFAEVFYRSFLRRLNAADAVLEARLAAAAEFGRDNPIWASPVLMTSGR